MSKNVQSVDNTILSRIYGSRGGATFSPGDFLDLGSRRAVDLALHRLVKRKILRRLARGLYEYPREHPELGTLSPDIEKVAQTLAGKHRIRLQPAGAYATNLLGLSEQVPAKIVFLTDGPSRTVRVGAQEIRLKQTTPRNMGPAGRTSGLVIQALRHLGQEHVDDAVIRSLKRKLSAKDKDQLLEDFVYAPAWVRALLRTIAKGDS